MAKFITFEGGEGAGKSTLIDAILEALTARGLAALKTRAPGGTKVGAEIRALLLHKKELALTGRAELLLFLADRAQHVKEVIEPALKEGKILLCDRFNDSTIAYQGGARTLGVDKVKELTHFASFGLIPDLTLYLDIDPAIGLKRAARAGGGKDRIEEETLAFHQTLREAYLAIAHEEPGRFKRIDASAAPAQVFRQAMEFIDALL